MTITGFKMYKPKGFQSVDEAQATVDWLLTHSLRHVVWNWLKSKIYHRSGGFDHRKER